MLLQQKSKVISTTAILQIRLTKTEFSLSRYIDALTDLSINFENGTLSAKPIAEPTRVIAKYFVR